MFSGSVCAGSATVGEKKHGDGCELKFEIPGLRDQIEAEAVMRLLMDKAKASIFVDAPRGGEMALRQRVARKMGGKNGNRYSSEQGRNQRIKESFVHARGIPHDYAIHCGWWGGEVQRFSRGGVWRGGARERAGAGRKNHARGGETGRFDDRDERR